MIRAYVLIMVLQQGYPEGALSTFTVNFENEGACRKARDIVLTDLRRSPNYPKVISQGCYPLGDK